MAKLILLYTGSDDKSEPFSHPPRLSQATFSGKIAEPPPRLAQPPPQSISYRVNQQRNVCWQSARSPIMFGSYQWAPAIALIASSTFLSKSKGPFYRGFFQELGSRIQSMLRGGRGQLTLLREYGWLRLPNSCRSEGLCAFDVP